MSGTEPLLQRLLGEPIRHQDVDHYILAVKKDVEGLLNTFSPSLQWSNEYAELETSLLRYGMPNYLAQEYQHMQQREKLCEQIQTRLAQNEPRLSDIRVSMQEGEQALDLLFHIRIEAYIKWQSQSKDVILESDWNPLNMSFTML